MYVKYELYFFNIWQKAILKHKSHYLRFWNNFYTLQRDLAKYIFNSITLAKYVFKVNANWL